MPLETAWMLGNKIIVNDQGKIILCDHCPCEEQGYWSDITVYYKIAKKEKSILLYGDRDLCIDDPEAGIDESWASQATWTTAEGYSSSYYGLLWECAHGWTTCEGPVPEPPDDWPAGSSLAESSLAESSLAESSLAAIITGCETSINGVEPVWCTNVAGGGYFNLSQNFSCDPGTAIMQVSSSVSELRFSGTTPVICIPYTERTIDGVLKKLTAVKLEVGVGSIDDVCSIPPSSVAEVTITPLATPTVSASDFASASAKILATVISPNADFYENKQIEY